MKIRRAGCWPRWPAAARFGRQDPEALKHTLTPAVDDGEGDLLLAVEVEVDGAFADPGLPGQVLHGHPAVTKTRQESLGGVEKGRARVVGEAGHHTRVVTGDQIRFLVNLSLPRPFASGYVTSSWSCSRTCKWLPEA
jgi:hypothetical protein